MLVRRLVRLLIVPVFMLCIGAYLVVAQQPCESQAQAILEMVNSLCENGERDRVCYGNIQVQAFPQPGVTHLNFEKPGDQEHVSLVKSLQLSPMNLPAETWGVARMRLTPTTAHSAADDVILLLFGDVKVEDQSQPRPSFDFNVTGNDSIRLRNFPSLDSTVLGWLEPGTQAVALGRLEDGSWLRVQKQPAGTVGWVNMSVLQADDLSQIDTLKIELPNAPYYGPMQAISYSSAGGMPSCGTLVPDGLLVQTSEGVARVTLLINEVTIDFVSSGAGATAFIQSQPDSTMNVTVLEGGAYTHSDSGSAQFVPPGAQVNISSDGTATLPVANDPGAAVQNLYGGLDRAPETVIWSPEIVANIDPAAAITPVGTQTTSGNGNGGGNANAGGGNANAGGNGNGGGSANAGGGNANAGGGSANAGGGNANAGGGSANAGGGNANAGGGGGNANAGGGNSNAGGNGRVSPE